MVQINIKVLQVNASSKFGGVSNMILNYCRNFDKNQFSFDFLSPEKTSYSEYSKEIKEDLKGNIYELNIDFHGIKKYFDLYKEFNFFLKKHDYDIVHIHSGLLMYNLVIAFVAKKRKIKKIIIHSHSAINYKGLKKIILHLLKSLVPYVATDYLACSFLAAQSMFPKKIIQKQKFVLMKNAIQVSNFSYNEQIRNEMKVKLGLNNDFIIGHIGRFVKVKNHEFLLQIFKEIVNIKPNSRLLLIGEGERIEKAKELAKRLKIINCISFIGQVSNPNNYYQVFDAFVLPSFYEGLPVVSIEAQAAGLPCFLSDTISTECALTKNVHFFSLNISPKEWAVKILEFSKYFKRYDTSAEIKKCGYDIEKETLKLKKIYLEE